MRESLPSLAEGGQGRRSGGWGRTKGGDRRKRDGTGRNGGRNGERRKGGPEDGRRMRAGLDAGGGGRVRRKVFVIAVFYFFQESRVEGGWLGRAAGWARWL